MTHAAGCGAVVGALAAIFKILGPAHAVAGQNLIERFAGNIMEIVAATLSFALLCIGAAALRNFIARRFIWPEAR